MSTSPTFNLEIAIVGMSDYLIEHQSRINPRAEKEPPPIKQS